LAVAPAFGIGRPPAINLIDRLELEDSYVKGSPQTGQGRSPNWVDAGSHRVDSSGSRTSPRAPPSSSAWRPGRDRRPCGDLPRPRRRRKSHDRCRGWVCRQALRQAAPSKLIKASKLTVARLIATTTCAAPVIAVSIAGASPSPPRSLRESTHTGTSCASSRRRNSATKTSSAEARYADSPLSASRGTVRSGTASHAGAGRSRRTRSSRRSSTLPSRRARDGRRPPAPPRPPVAPSAARRPPAAR
jgi:hypothetical protein